MGTNFYLLSKYKRIHKKWFSESEYEIVTEGPCRGYITHIAKISCGWLPLFQAHDNVNSISDMKKIYDGGGFQIVDEYGKPYTWDDFDRTVLQFNGGVRGVAPVRKRNHNPSGSSLLRVDPNMPDHTPVSHFEYANGRYKDEYFTDELGYEFTKHEFS